MGSAVQDLHPSSWLILTLEQQDELVPLGYQIAPSEASFL
jgi:hypothetical protein